MSMRAISLAVVVTLAMPPVVMAGDAIHPRPPAEFNQFCARSPDQCRPRGSSVGRIVLDQRMQNTLQAVNTQVNRSVTEVSDRNAYGREDVWRLPTGGFGDCEDFAIMKRKRLLDMGLPSSALLLTAGQLPSGEVHVVLTVTTDQGDLVLDNRTDQIRPVQSAGLIFFSRQSSGNPRVWDLLSRDGKLN